MGYTKYNPGDEVLVFGHTHNTINSHCRIPGRGCQGHKEDYLYRGEVVSAEPEHSSSPKEIYVRYGILIDEVRQTRNKPGSRVGQIKTFFNREEDLTNQDVMSRADFAALPAACEARLARERAESQEKFYSRISDEKLLELARVINLVSWEIELKRLANNQPFRRGEAIDLIVDAIGFAKTGQVSRWPGLFTILAGGDSVPAADVKKGVLPPDWENIQWHGTSNRSPAFEVGLDNRGQVWLTVVTETHGGNAGYDEQYHTRSFYQGERR